MDQKTNPLSTRGSISSLVDTLDPNYRRGLDRAIIERDPPSLADVYLHFHVRSNGISRSAFYRYAARLRAHADLAESAELARADGRDPIDEMSTLLDAHFLRVLATHSPAKDPENHDPDAYLEDPSDPCALDDPTLQRLHRIVMMRQRLAVSRLLNERAATHRDDAQRRRNDKHIRDLAATLRALASSRLADAAADRARARAARDNDGPRPAVAPPPDAPHRPNTLDPFSPDTRPDGGE